MAKTAKNSDGEGLSRPPIDRALDELGDAISVLDCTIADMVTRLASVLKPTQQVSEKTASPDTTQNNSPICELVVVQKERLIAITGRINMILADLEL